jgi:IS30 family transposase
MTGSWEGDLIEGASNKSVICVLVKHSTRLVLLIKMPDETVESTLTEFSFNLNEITAPLR